jgi:hypothetical protein
VLETPDPHPLNFEGLKIGYESLRPSSVKRIGGSGREVAISNLQKCLAGMIAVPCSHLLHRRGAEGGCFSYGVA